MFSLVGGLILFIWQFLSFAMPNLHKSAMEYTPVQDEVLAAIASSGLKEGMYMLGQPDPSLSGAESEKAMEKYEGKPWAILNYQAENKDKMVMNMIRGFIICLIISAMFFWVISQQKDPSLKKSILTGLAIGLIGFFFVPYTGFIWFKAPDIWAYLADGIVPWAILGWVGHKMA